MVVQQAKPALQHTVGRGRPTACPKHRCSGSWSENFRLAGQSPAAGDAAQLCCSARRRSEARVRKTIRFAKGNAAERHAAVRRRTALWYTGARWGGRHGVSGGRNIGRRGRTALGQWRGGRQVRRRRCGRNTRRWNRSARRCGRRRSRCRFCERRWRVRRRWRVFRVASSPRRCDRSRGISIVICRRANLSRYRRIRSIWR